MTVVLAVLIAACGPAPTSEPPPALGQPLAGLQEREQGRFLLGKAVFERLATEEEGLGPLYNAPRCSGCHDDPVSGGTSGVRVTKATRWENGRCDLLHDVGGDNIQQLATSLLRARGMGPETLPETANNRAVVLATTLFGLGLVEAVPVAALERFADPEDRDGDGISGRLGTTEAGSPGRFGRKADVATIRDFVDTALRFEMGFSTPDHPFEERVNGVAIPPGADPMPEPEIDDRGVDLLAEYLRYLAPPPRTEASSEAEADSIRRGGAVFREVGCASCHVPELRTDRHDIAALSRVPVPLYSDLLLHDLGPALAGVCGPGASPTEHRTARLWGLGSRRVFLHDGRASTLEDAIDLHGGEASEARSLFSILSAPDVRSLILFLRSL